MEEQGNFHPITEGEAYRSSQLDKDELEYYIKKNNIRSVLNLRGANVDKPWYREEINVCAEHKVMHHDVPLSASREPTDEEIQKIMEIFISAPRPILIHCKSGADRAGLVAAMWKVVVDKEPKSIAEKQLSIMFGHLPVGSAIAMDLFFQKWTPPAYREPCRKVR
jgi:protein tyrosine/serine phosphatase